MDAIHMAGLPRVMLVSDPGRILRSDAKMTGEYDIHPPEKSSSMRPHWRKRGETTAQIIFNEDEQCWELRSVFRHVFSSKALSPERPWDHRETPAGDTALSILNLES